MTHIARHLACHIATLTKHVERVARLAALAPTAVYLFRPPLTGMVTSHLALR
jgi:hypothetical protein